MNVIQKINIALAGNPNCGKSTLFNELTGARQTIGNFPGVTVERYEGQTQYQGRKITFIDLPGVYSLSSFSDEERVAAEYLTQENPDLIINIVDAANLERNLYLTLLLKELDKPMFVVLNMIDVAKRRGIEIDIAALSRLLGVPVLTAIGNRGIGINEILAEIIELIDLKNNNLQNGNPNQNELENGQEKKESLNEISWLKWESERQKDKTSKEEHCPSCQQGNCCINCRSGIAWQTAKDIARYKEINRICIHSVRSLIPLEPNKSDLVDGVLTNKYIGIPVFLLAMYLVFQLTFTIGQFPMNWIENGFEILSDMIIASWPEGQWPFLKSLLVDGIIGGVGGVLIFLPNILFLFLAISILEDSGYMARAALLCDRWMHKIGLHGRSIVPMLIGFGCTVPALLATKMLSDRKERLTTMFVLPLFSCGARFPIYAMLIPAFFPLRWQGPVLWLLYCIGILLAILIAKWMSCFFPKNDEIPFIIELPPYHFPTFRSVGIQTLKRGWQYMKKAGTVILGISIVLWFITNYPGLSADQKTKFEQQRSLLTQNVQNEETLRTELSQIDNEEAQRHLSNSYAGRLGQMMEPALLPMGFDWKIGTALVGAIAAKEVFVAQMAIIYSVSNTEKDSTGLARILAQNYSPLTGFCILLFCLIASPCMATFTIMAKESGSWKWAFAQWLLLTGVAWFLTTITYQLGKLFLA